MNSKLMVTCAKSVFLIFYLAKKKTNGQSSITILAEERVNADLKLSPILQCLDEYFLKVELTIQQALVLMKLKNSHFSIYKIRHMFHMNAFIFTKSFVNYYN